TNPSSNGDLCVRVKMAAAFTQTVRKCVEGWVVPLYVLSTTLKYSTSRSDEACLHGRVKGDRGGNHVG
ncbi:hypothetical protein CEXT_417571, partial [Caerostris extrusa]